MRSIAVLRGRAAALLVCLALFALVHPGARPAGAVSRSDGIRSQDLIQPAALARALSGPAARRPMLVHVGFEALYRGGHIPGSVYAGPGNSSEGIQALRAALQPVPRAKSVVLYCGCCPWSHCPNVGPAFQAARAMGFRNLKVLYVSDNLQSDWAEKAYPLVSGAK